VTPKVIVEIVSSIDEGYDLVANSHQQDGFDPESLPDLQSLYLQSIAHSLSAIARLMARGDEDVWQEWLSWNTTTTIR
jgi:hypothetical protein